MTFKPAEVKCDKCNEPGLKLKWHGRDLKGNVFLDLVTNDIHKCKREFLKNDRLKSYKIITRKELEKIKEDWDRGADYYNRYYVNNPNHDMKHFYELEHNEYFDEISD